MDLKQLLATTPETLAQQQYDALRKAAASLLGKLAGHIERGEISSAQAMLMTSLAGDVHGCDNQCINFDVLLDRRDEGCHSDIGTVLARLENLWNIIGKSK